MLLTQYGKTEPIRISHNDLLFQMLSYTRLTDGGQNRAREWANSTLLLELEDRLAVKISSRAHQVGWHLFQHHIYHLMVYVQGQTDAGAPAMTSIKNYYDLHDITEDDFALESAYKRWQRFCWGEAAAEKNTSIFCAKKGWRGASLHRKPRATISLKIRATDAEVKSAIERFNSLLDGCFQKPPKKLVRHGLFFFWQELGRLTTRQIGKRLKVHRNTVAYGTAAIRREMEVNPTFRTMVERLCADALDGKVLKTPISAPPPSLCDEMHPS